MTSRAEDLAGRVLVLMPTQRDAERTVLFLGEAAVSCFVCDELATLCREFRAGAGAVLLTDDALSLDSAGQLSETIRAQPAWSSMPIIVMAREGWSKFAPGRAQELQNSLVIVERPARTRTLVEVVGSALRARRHQYQLRDQLSLREREAQQLEALNDALQQSQSVLARQAEELRVAARRKDEFLATLAHELRNPLAPIRSGLELLARSPDAQVSARTLGVMHRQIGHMVRLIDDLLDVSRITSGKLQLARKRVDVGTIIETAVEASRPLIDRKRHTLNVSVREPGLTLHADLTRLAQAIGNLLNNSSHYTSEGGLIELSTRQDVDSVVIEVHDNGSGIPGERLSDVFNMFSQIDRELERAQGGLGIGLALVRSLVEMHGGTVSAASPGPGQGSTFTIRMPLSDPAAAATPAGPQPAAASGAAGKRLLVVDDNEDGAEMLALVLGQAGYQIKTAYDGRSALAAVEEWRPELVILDIGLPDMNGYDVARELRSRRNLGGLGLVALTGWGTQDDKQKALAAGFDAHLTKPVDAGELQRVLGKLEQGGADSRRPSLVSR